MNTKHFFRILPHHESSSEEKFGYFLGAAAASLLVGWTRPKLLLNMRRSRFFLTGLKYEVHFLYDGGWWLFCWCWTTTQIPSTTCLSCVTGGGVCHHWQKEKTESAWVSSCLVAPFVLPKVLIRSNLVQSLFF